METDHNNELEAWLAKYHPDVLTELKATMEFEAGYERYNGWDLIDFCDLRHEKLYAEYCESGD